jgi:hypothetical protein
VLTRIGLDVPFGRYCATYDDQMALMPRSLAEAFFALENPGPPNAASFGAFTAGFDVQAVRETYGTDPSPDAHYRTCASRYHVSFERPSPWNLSDLNSVTWANAHYDTAAGLYGPGNTMPRRDRTVCCEMRNAWRLIGRLVPLDVHPFPVCGPHSHCIKHAETFPGDEKVC